MASLDTELHFLLVKKEFFQKNPSAGILQLRLMQGTPTLTRPEFPGLSLGHVRFRPTSVNLRSDFTKLAGVILSES
jgi:hypothetical protein